MWLRAIVQPRWVLSSVRIADMSIERGKSKSVGEWQSV